MLAPSARNIVTLAIVACMAACSHAWDDLDPRLAGGSGGAGATPSNGGATSTGGTTSTGGSGGSVVSSSSAGAAGGNGGSGPLTFFDDFDRPDDATIGNGWIEKTPDAFDLIGNHVVKVAAAGSYRQNLVYRPMNEAMLDVEASVTIEFTTATIQRPQLFVRAPFSDITVADGYVSYKLWINGSATSAQLSQQNGTGGSTSLQAITLAPGLVMGERYRMRLRVEGTDPVQLEAHVEHWLNSSWTIVGQANYSDSAATRIVTPGVVGFAGSSATGYVMDDFSYTPL